MIMVKAKYTTTEIKKIVKALVETLIANNIAVDKIILYGSQATGRPRNHSDIDIAVISPSFKGEKSWNFRKNLQRHFQNIRQ